MTSPPHSCWINRWMRLWPVTPEVDCEHGHSASYWSAVAWGAWGKESRMEFWLGCGDKRTRWGQQVVYRETSSAEKQYHYPHQLLTCCLWSWAGSICMILSGYAEVRQPHICMLCVSVVLLTQQHWIFTCLLTHLIGFTHCRHLNTHAWIELHL